MFPIFQPFFLRSPKACGPALSLILAALFTALYASAAEYRVTSNPDKSLSYVFANERICNKSADYDTAIKADASISIKKLFSFGGSVEKTTQQLKQLSPKAQDFEALAFDLCFELESGRMSKEEYDKRRAMLDEVRLKALAGKAGSVADDARYSNIRGSCIATGDNSPVVCGSVGGDVIINIEKKQ
jgi:hypothetical protein